jgi:hypothetical protein
MQALASSLGPFLHLVDIALVFSTLASAGVVSPAASLKASDYVDENICNVIVSATV